MTQSPGWHAIHVDEVKPINWRYTNLAWRPLRHELDARSVGIAAFTATAVGQDVVEPHVETRDGRGNEEIYIVVRGRAKFDLGNAEVDAPVETCIRVSPETYRHAPRRSPTRS